MQPNLPQDEKFNYAAKQHMMARYLSLSDRATGPQTIRHARRHASDLAGIGLSVFSDARTRRASRRSPTCCPTGTVLITGGVRAADSAAGARAVRAYNSVYVIDHDGTDPVGL